VALYSNSTAIPSRRDLLLGETDFPFTAVKSNINSQALVYLAGPFFTLQDRWLIEETRDALSGFGIRVFSPLHDVGEGDAEVVAPKDLEALTESKFVLALLEGLDPGTLFEVGFARAREIPVLAYVGEVSPTHLKMISGSKCAIERDYTTALYRTAWNALSL
jgi:nucleoside 2-deoxyribosyltransferase